MAKFSSSIPSQQILPPRHGMFAVSLTEDGGSAGDASTQCSFTYTVKNLSGDVTYGTAMTPGKARPAIGALISGGGLVGSGYRDTTGAFVLYDANEVIDTEAC